MQQPTLEEIKTKAIPILKQAGVKKEMINSALRVIRFENQISKVMFLW
ncbi:hypothetical protein KJ980_01675 [Patescibacteria group bacterium]|nr:hypothetical protein [Patescibacteria group bacterium]MBU4016894.1 hypothetical protein [Patescibacteria group bacterium]MBU4098337.1 hypothetical protein [Patescibacteria group bacterium]